MRDPDSLPKPIESRGQNDLLPLCMQNRQHRRLRHHRARSDQLRAVGNESVQQRSMNCIIDYRNWQGHLVLTAKPASILQNEDEYDQYRSSDEEGVGSDNGHIVKIGVYPDQNRNQDSLKDGDDSCSTSSSSNGDQNACALSIPIRCDCITMEASKNYSVRPTVGIDALHKRLVPARNS
jgi:hypothetical protein